MEKRIVLAGDERIAVIYSNEVIVPDAQSALNLIMSAFYDDGCSGIVLNKEAFPERFFVLSSGLAGEVLQKAVNYRMKLAITGDFSGYTSKPLHDFIYECNKGKHVFFAADEQEAINMLAKE